MASFFSARAWNQKGVLLAVMIATMLPFPQTSVQGSSKCAGRMGGFQPVVAFSICDCIPQRRSIVMMSNNNADDNKPPSNLGPSFSPIPNPRPKLPSGTNTFRRPVFGSSSPSGDPSPNSFKVEANNDESQSPEGRSPSTPSEDQSAPAQKAKYHSTKESRGSGNGRGRGAVRKYGLSGSQRWQRIQHLQYLGPASLLEPPAESNLNPPWINPALNNTIRDSTGDAKYGQRHPGTRVLLPKNLSSYIGLAQLLDELEKYREDNRAGNVAPSDAVAAMNHLKRTSKQVKANMHLSDKFHEMFQEFATTATRGFPWMSGKNIALALNAAASVSGNQDTFRQAAARIAQLCEQGHEIHTQSLAMMVNSFTKQQFRDPVLFRHMAAVAQRIPTSNYSHQAIAILLNGYSKSGTLDDGTSHFDYAPLFQHLSLVARSMDRTGWDAQGIALVLNSFARMHMKDEALFSKFGEYACGLPPSSFTAQNVANIVNAMGKLSLRNEELLRHMSTAARMVPVNQYEPQVCMYTCICTYMWCAFCKKIHARMHICTYTREPD
jgi:hypothetical protein